MILDQCKKFIAGDGAFALLSKFPAPAQLIVALLSLPADFKAFKTLCSVVVFPVLGLQMSWSMNNIP